MDSSRKRSEVEAQEGLVTAEGVARNGFTVERGPGWLFVRVPESGVRDTVGVVSGLLKTAMTKRVVLELDGISSVGEDLAEAISKLGHHVEQEGGVIRICGLSDSHLATIRLAPGSSRIPHYACRAEAVRAARDPALAPSFGQAGAMFSGTLSSSHASSPPGADGSRPS